MDQSKIGKFIMACRREQGLTQAQLAEKLHITDRAVSKWETGKSLPDSSIMLALCEILGITADELLSGGRETRPADPPPPSPPERRVSRGAGRRWWCGVLFTGGLLAGVLVCFICDGALSGGLSWSLLAALSAGYGWAVLFPVLALRRGVGSLLALSVLTVPYLYGLSCLLAARAVFTVGAVLAVISILFLWLAFADFKRLGRTRAAVGIGWLLLAGLTAAVNGALYLLGVTPSPGVWNWMSVPLLLLASAASFTWRRSGEKE